MFTANSVQVLQELPLCDLLDLYDGVVAEMERMSPEQSK